MITGGIIIVIGMMMNVKAKGKLPALMNVRRPIMPNWSTTMFAGMFVTRPDRGRVRLKN